jgi:uncharacterized membrane protein YfcA
VTALGAAFAVLIGLLLGLLGGGGSVLTVPVFVYLLGIAPKPAIAMSMPVVGTASLVGAMGHWRHGNVDVRSALVFGVVAMAGAFGGARLATFLSGAAQLALLGAVMLAVAASMLRAGRGAPHAADGERAPLADLGPEAPGEAERDASPSAPRAANPTRRATGNATGGATGEAWTARTLLLLSATALGVGVLTGLVGIGGGFLIVPALVLIVGVPMKRAIGTSLLVIAMNSLSGFLGYRGQVEVSWSFVATFTGVAVVGIMAGTLLVRHVPAALLRRGFALFLIAMSVFVLWQNRGVFG